MTAGRPAAAKRGGSSLGAEGVAVKFQADGLPRLPSDLHFHQHYAPEHHCPVCSLEDGKDHDAAGGSSHASNMLKAQQAAAKRSFRELRSIDEHGLALLKLLRRPGQQPSWWGVQHAEMQGRLARVLESSSVHYIIIALTLLDLAVVVTELILSSIFPNHEDVPHTVHTVEEVLSWLSISILCIFVAELLAKLAVFGHSYFTRSWWHTVDAVVVVASLSLELTLKGVAQEVASLLVFFRLWRLLRVMHGVAEAMELNHEHEIESHHRLVHGLQKDLAEERQQVRQLKREVEALSNALAGAGLSVDDILRHATTAASQPDGMLEGAPVKAAEDGRGFTAAGSTSRGTPGSGNRLEEV